MQECWADNGYHPAADGSFDHRIVGNLLADELTPIVRTLAARPQPLYASCE
jgi:hypothetical protein